MIASFFRHLEEQSVEWLLISGQAARDCRARRSLLEAIEIPIEIRWRS